MFSKAIELGRILRTTRLASAELESLRLKKLRAVISNAYEHVPYYRSLFRSVGMSPRDIQAISDLRNIPVTTKDDIRTLRFRDITADRADRPSLIATETSGSTGKPFTVYRSPSEESTCELLNMASLISAGFRPRDRLVFLGPEREIAITPLHQIGLFRRYQIPLSNSVDEQVRQIREIQPTILWVYPSVLRAFLQAISVPLGHVMRPRIIITSAEVLENSLKERLEDETGAKVLNFYGAMEFGRIGWECKVQESLHVHAGHFVFECLEPRALDGVGEVGVTTVTSLYAFAMPLIRYELGDLSRILETRCTCGSPFPLILPPIGRENDMVLLPSGNIKSPLHFDSCVMGFDGIDRWRVIQDTKSKFVLQLVLRKPPLQTILCKIRERFVAYLDETVDLEIQIVDFIADDRRKFRHFISKLDQEGVKTAL